MTYSIASRKRLSWQEQIKVKFRRIMVPYFVFGGLSYTYWALFERKFRVDVDVPIYKPLVGLLWGSGSDNLTFNAALWYLPCLFIVTCLFVSMRFYLKNQYAYVICLMLVTFLGILIGTYSSIRLPWGADISLFALLFYSSGYYMFPYIKRINKLSIYLKVVMGIGFLAINIPFALRNGITGMASVIYGNVFLFVIAALSGSLFVIILSQMIFQNRFLEFLGKNSIIVMCIHEPIRRIVIKLFSIGFGIDVSLIRSSIFYSILVCLIVIFMVIPGCFVIRRKMLWMLGVKG